MSHLDQEVTFARAPFSILPPKETTWRPTSTTDNNFFYLRLKPSTGLAALPSSRHFFSPSGGHTLPFEQHPSPGSCSA
ncbi:hypothetical protein HYQ45_011543 [Verticillium longisporum]|uniref:Uncharacterized protein n=1 Tax=Verticillium longisporum TaxID=100787 RepID=A0A8I3AL41_VERLO|nr:hypothetical protein HYQ45_018694 [Verticillium longisporum]KAG7129197.1 hypothetical protein HYQ45_011543 [Verticillium longisporum]